jgi:hypothetical protein
VSEDGDGADAFGLFGVVGEAGVAPGLFGVDAVALITGDLANGDRVAVGSTLDRALADGGEVVVPVGVGRCASLGSEHVDDAVVGLVGQIHHGGDVLVAALAAAMGHQDHRRAFEGPADAAFVGAELIDGLRVPVGRLWHGSLLARLGLMDGWWPDLAKFENLEAERFELRQDPVHRGPVLE